MQWVEVLVVGLAEVGSMINQLYNVSNAERNGPMNDTSLMQSSRSCCRPGLIQSEMAVIPAGLKYNCK